MPSVGEKATAIRLGSYEILDMFAQGGMAELYFARSIGPEGFEKLVVLKKILPTFAENARFVRLFLDEAKLAASLDHPGIAHVYDLGRVDGNYFFTMEYVHGQDVRKILRRATRGDKMPIEHAVLIARSVAGALHYAHERRGPDGALLGIVHRDVSPSNIVVSYEGAVKLLDFGVAKAATSTVKTRTGTLKGKVAYMSPEQAKGAAIDRRSDIFSAGIVMWEMVATQRLYKGDNDLATIQLIINQPPPPLVSIRPECPAELDRIIQRALAQDPEKRYQTAQELQSDLDELARETKLNQSSIALSAHMAALFAPELEAWRDAQAKGVSLADHIVSASPNPSKASVGPFDEVDGEDDDESDGSVSSADDDERTERVEVPLPPSVVTMQDRPTPLAVPIIAAPPVAVTRAPTPPPTRAPTPPPTRAPTPPPTRAPTPPPVAATRAPVAVAAPPKKKRKRAKEPQSWASEPSVVLDAALVVALADAAPEPESEPEAEAVAVTPIEKPDPPPRASAPRLPSSGREVRTMLMTAVADPTERSRRTLWIAGAVVVAVMLVGVGFAASHLRHSPAPEPAAVAKPPVAAEPPPVAAESPAPIAQPAPVQPVAPPPVVRPLRLEVPIAAKHPRSHPPVAKPPRKKDPKFDPDAPLPPM